MTKAEPLAKLRAAAVKIAAEELGRSSVRSVRLKQGLDLDGEPNVEVLVIVSAPINFSGSSMARIGRGIRREFERLGIERRVYTDFLPHSSLKELEEVDGP